MHVSYTRLDKKKGVGKKLSLIKNDRKGSFACDSDNLEEDSLRENFPPKTQLFKSLTTGIKRPSEEKTPHINKFQRTSEGKSVVSSTGQQRIDMLNGYHTESQNSFGGRKANEGRPPIATLSNLGNTCFLNSILYTLRFTPNFLHNLHHLVSDLALADQKLGQVKAKSSSLGRNFANLATTGSRSWSSKDLPSLGGLHESGVSKSKIQIITEKMHEMYASLHAAEVRDSWEPYQAETFLSALRNVNSIFEGNQQQDAHELLMCVLDSIRETCRSLQLRFNHQPEIPNGINPTEHSPAAENETLVCSKPALGIFRKSWKNKKKAKTSKLDSPTKENNGKSPPIMEDENAQPSNEWCKNLGFDFVAEDFEGTTVLRTTCLECEMVTERKQTMCDISVPIPEDKRSDSDRTGDPSAVYQHACVTSECLRDQNKYWCDQCVRYNEARRQVTYETLPRLVVLQLKRFSGGMEKLTAHMPTPLRLACFCDTCCPLPAAERPHQYTLYAVIMHLGQTLTGGHYIAYTRANYADYSTPYICCERDIKSCLVSNSNEKSNFMKNLFARNKNNGVSVTDKGQPVKRKVPLSTVPPASTSNDTSFCSSLDCCGIRLGQGVWSPEELAASKCLITCSDLNVWLMCDDETVKPISNEEFDELLSSKPKIRSASTPYLLFYVKTDIEQ